jgi:hypothetical protein
MFEYMSVRERLGGILIADLHYCHMCETGHVCAAVVVKL